MLPAPTVPSETASPKNTTGSSPGRPRASCTAPATVGHSAGPDLVAEAARAVLKLLLMHKQSGGTIPPDVSELVAQLGR